MAFGIVAMALVAVRSMLRLVRSLLIALSIGVMGCASAANKTILMDRWGIALMGLSISLGCGVLLLLLIR